MMQGRGKSTKHWREETTRTGAASQPTGDGMRAGSRREGDALQAQCLPFVTLEAWAGDVKVHGGHPPHASGIGSLQARLRSS